MTEKTKLSTTALSRRSFLVTVGGASIAVAFGGLPKDALSAGFAPEAVGEFQPNFWVTIADDGAVSIISPASEMGQGIMTTLPLLIAEEMDADWSKVRVVQAPADAEKYGNPGFFGLQLTAASLATPGYYELLRLVGAQTRKVLLAKAADLLGVSVAELSTEPNRVTHRQSGRSLGYGEIAASGALPVPLPQASTADLKPLDRCRYIGSRTIGRIDVPSKVDGSARFGADVRLPGMLYGSVLRAPVPGEGPESVDDAAALGVAGVTQVVSLPYGVGVIGETVEAVWRAKELLVVTWSHSSRVRDYSSDSLLETYRDIGRDLDQAGVIVIAEGDASAAIAGAARIIEVDYLTDHVHHMTMEPMNATALVTDDAVEVWAPTQAPMRARETAARLSGVAIENVAVHTMLLGGGFGRRAEDDFIIDAVLLAAAAPGRPIKALWSFEDDVRHGTYRPLVAQHAQIGLDANGDIVGWRHRIVADSLYARWYPEIYGDGSEGDDIATEGMEVDYRIPARLVEYMRQDSGQAVGFWRSTSHGYMKFGVECLIDEAAAAKGVDPLAFRLDLLSGDPRGRKVVETVAGMAEWDRERDGRALGLAYSDGFDAYCAQIAEVSLDRESGEIRVHAVWCAIDAGLAIQPLNIEAQMIGGITQGASHALYERISIVDGEVQESNYDSYRVMRMSEAPEIHVSVIETPENPPAGVGEVGLPLTGPAIANAVARLTGGVRLRHYPFLPERVKAALDA